jgi:hypothetical protein
MKYKEIWNQTQNIIEILCILLYDTVKNSRYCQIFFKYSNSVHRTIYKKKSNNICKVKATVEETIPREVEVDYLGNFWQSKINRTGL